MQTNDILSVSLTGFTAALFLAAYTNEPQPAFLVCAAGLAALTFIKAIICGGVQS